MFSLVPTVRTDVKLNCKMYFVLFDQTFSQSDLAAPGGLSTVDVSFGNLYCAIAVQFYFNVGGPAIVKLEAATTGEEFLRFSLDKTLFIFFVQNPVPSSCFETIFS